MGQKTNTVGIRLGITSNWESQWYDEKEFADKLQEDERIRKYVRTRLKKAGIARIQIERTAKRIALTINTSKPGVVIGKQGAEVDKLKEEVKKLTGKEVNISINEIKRPELDATLVADNIAAQLENRVAFRRAMKMSISSTMRMGAEGIRIICSGRLGGAEMARTEQYKEGRIPLHTLRADIDYARSTAFTIYGAIGVKVWICKGEVIGSRQDR
ncbi:MAG: 30S ribosomal protein S3 [Bacteroidetes bacterium]|nr:30S ribosomal protein S3 [Bacteroidota bacterium]